MKIMCDTSIILDVLLDWEPFAEDSCQVLRHCPDRIHNPGAVRRQITSVFYCSSLH